MACEIGMGLIQHDKSKSHLEAMTILIERESRNSGGASVDVMVSHDSIQKNRYYIYSIFDMIRLLAVNEMSLRGDKEITDEHFSRSKFLNLFEFDASNDKNLAGIVKTVSGKCQVLITGYPERNIFHNE